MPKLVPKSSKKQEPEFMLPTRVAFECALDNKAIDTRAFDLRGLTLIADSFVVCSAASDPQARALFNHVKDGLRDIGIKPIHTEGMPGGEWMVLDFGTVIVHIFREQARAFYDLDGLWGDAPRLDPQFLAATR